MQGSWADNDSSLFTLITLSHVSADGLKHKGASVSLFKGLNFTRTKQSEETFDLSDKTKELCLNN